MFFKFSQENLYFLVMLTGKPLFFIGQPLFSRYVDLVRKTSISSTCMNRQKAKKRKQNITLT